MNYINILIGWLYINTFTLLHCESSQACISDGSYQFLLSSGVSNALSQGSTPRFVTVLVTETWHPVTGKDNHLNETTFELKFNFIIF